MIRIDETTPEDTIRAIESAEVYDAIEKGNLDERRVRTVAAHRSERTGVSIRECSSVSRAEDF